MSEKLTADKLPDLLDSLSGGVLITDDEWVVQFVNDYALDFWGKRRDEVIGQNLWEVFPQIVGRPLHRQMTRAAEESVSMEFEARSTTGRWVSVQQSQVDNGQFIYFDDITERYLTTTRLETKYGITRILTDAESIDEAAAPVIDTIRECLEAECGSFWVPGPEDGHLTCIEYRGPEDREDCGAFAETTLETTFAFGEGLPGRTWQRREASWIPEVAEDDNFPRASLAARAELTSGFAFPIMIGEDLYGVMEFFTADRIELSDAMLEMMQSIGGEIGQFIQRSQTEGQLVETNRRYRAVLDSALDSIIAMDEKGRITEFNPAAEETFGYDRDDVIGEYLADCIIPPELREDHWKGLERLLEADESNIIGERIEMPAMHADGSTFPVELTVTQQSYDGERFFTGYLRNLAEQKRVERKRRASEERFRAVAEHSADVIAIIDADTRIQYVSPAADALLGHAPEELEGRELTELLADDEAHTLRNKITQSFYQTDHEAISFTLGYEHPDGTTRHLSYKAKDLLDNPGIEGVLLNIRDVTEERARQQRLREAKEEAEEMTRLKSTLLANMSHEIRTPLSSLLGWIEVLKQESSEADRETVETIERGAYRLSETLDSVLALAQLEGQALEPELEAVSVCRQVDQIAGEFEPKASDKGLALRTFCESPEMVASLDRTFLDRILNNLVSNAVKFTDEGTVSITALEDGDTVTIRVRDTGPGISEEFLPQIFSEFEQESSGYDRTHEGTGLGLAITERLVEAMEGSISVSSQQGEGTTFTVELPKSLGELDQMPADAAETSRGEPEEVAPRETEPLLAGDTSASLSDLEEASEELGRVMVVEDQDDIRALIARTLGEVTTVEDFADAEAALERADDETFDLVLMDISLPGMDGIEATRQLRGRKA
ncbi:MAG: PAS domain S-box protein, partial [Bradymonadaceae bacterium]